MMKLVDITGTAEAPFCPNCSTKSNKYGLVQMEELNTNLQKSGGVWRCGHCFHAFRFVSSI